MSTLPLSRRSVIGRVLAMGAATLGVAACGQAIRLQTGRDPFTLGVASGYPMSDGVVLWTRLAPDPLDGGGMGPADVDVAWELAHDESFRSLAAQGVATARAAEAHAVHVEAAGLQPARPYWYRFTAGAARSAVGRTQTAPAVQATAPIRFAFAACQQYEQGYFAAYRDMAAQPLDLVLHLGDYIYESSWGSHRVRRHASGIPTQLEEFRNRYALYKSDPDLQAAHAAFPWCVIWDDHEVANDYTDDVSPVMPDPAQFLAVRAAAYQAWYEHMPVPARMRPRGPHARIHHRLRCGQMLDVLLLDGRQYRSHHVCLPGRDTGPMVNCADRLDPRRSYLGAEQEAWLDAELALPPTRWTVLAQPTLLAEAARGTSAEPRYWMDGWDGYPAARQRLLDSIAARRPRNALVVGGDVHSFWAADLKRSPAGPTLAAEFVGGAITAEGPIAATVTTLLARNPHLRYGRGDRRGYAVMALDERACRVEFRAVDDVKRPASVTRTLVRFAVADGAAGVLLEGV